MRYILIILVFLSVGANAQMVIKAHANYRPYAAPVSANLLLDDYPNAAAAYSLRKLDKDYAGSCIRVRRSNDNAESDIGFTSSGDLDTATLKTFVGANSGFVTTWYNQGDSIFTTSFNATNTTSASQPRIVNLGAVERINNRPSIFFDGSNDFLSTDGFDNVNQFSVYSVAKPNTTISPSSILGSLSGPVNVGQIAVGWGFSGSKQHLFWRDEFMSASTNDVTTSMQLMSYAKTGSTSNWTGRYFLNGATNGTFTSSGNSPANSIITIGSLGTSFWFLQGYISEIIYYRRNNTSNRSDIESNINTYYSIY